jgi:hypothetical protein
MLYIFRPTEIQSGTGCLQRNSEFRANWSSERHT